MDYEIELKALKLELEREKNKNYILKKENEILMGNIGLISADQEVLINKVNELKQKVLDYENMQTEEVSQKKRSKRNNKKAFKE